MSTSTFSQACWSLAALVPCLLLCGCGRLHFGEASAEQEIDQGTRSDQGSGLDMGTLVDLGTDLGRDAGFVVIMGLDMGTAVDVGIAADMGTTADMGTAADMGAAVDMGMGTGLGEFGAAVVVPELDGTQFAHDPTLTADELEIMLVTNAGLRTATRASRNAAWGPLTAVSEFSGLGNITDPELSADGLQVFLTVDGDDSLEQEIFGSTRASRSADWSPPVRVTELSTSSEDCCASATPDGLLMVFASTRAGAYALYEASRTTTAQPWSNITPLTSLNSSSSTLNAMVTPDGLAVVFDSSRTGNRDLFFAARVTRSSPFASPTPISELNTGANERDPWLSEDGLRIYFARGPDRYERIHVAERTP